VTRPESPSVRARLGEPAPGVTGSLLASAIKTLRAGHRGDERRRLVALSDGLERVAPSTGINGG
jgi:hypothetical protein